MGLVSLSMDLVYMMGLADSHFLQTMTVVGHSGMNELVSRL